MRAHAGAHDLRRPGEDRGLRQENLRHACRHGRSKDRSQISRILNVFQQQAVRNALRHWTRLRRPDDRRHTGRAHELGDAVEEAVREREARTRRNVFEKPADLRIGKGGVAGEDRLGYAAALLIRTHQMLAFQKRGTGPASLPRRSGQLDQGLDLRVVFGLDGLHSMAQVRNPAKMSPRSGV